MRQQAFKTGSEFPPCQPGLMRIYSMRFCPYAERALLVANFKDILHEVVNINLTEKPSWFLEKNPDGTVPVVEQDQQVVCGSLVCADYLDEAHQGGGTLTPSDPYRRARDKMLVERFGKVGMQFFGSFPALQDGDVQKAEELFKAMEWVEDELGTRKTNFFSGESLGMVDLMIWPWFERVEVVSTVPIPGEQLPKLTAWMARMRQEPLIKKVCVQPDLLKSFFMEYRTKSVDYDKGL